MRPQWPYVASIVLHTALGAGLLVLAPLAEKRQRSRPVEISVRAAPKVQRVDSPPPTPPAPQPPPVKMPPLLRARRIERSSRPLEVAPPQVLPPSPPPVAPPIETPQPAAPPTFGVSMEATLQGGSSVSAPLGGSVMTAPESKGGGKGQGAPMAAAPPKVTLPEMLHEEKALYPRQASEEGIEGLVVLLVTIDENGRVKRARVVKGLGHGLDEAAVEALRRSTFRPSMVDGRPRETEIRYTYKFVLDE